VGLVGSATGSRGGKPMELTMLRLSGGGRRMDDGISTI
jgi:hypothetical protein